jgi:CIC family chloride channel protein
LFRFARDSFYFPVVNNTGRMVGVVSMQDVKNILHDEEQRVCYLVGGICSRNVIKLTPDDNLYDAMQLFDLKGIEEIPVVESQDDPWVLGLLRRRDVIAAYNQEVLKRGHQREGRDHPGALFDFVTYPSRAFSGSLKRVRTVSLFVLSA